MTVIIDIDTSGALLPDFESQKVLGRLIAEAVLKRLEARCQTPVK